MRIKPELGFALILISLTACGTPAVPAVPGLPPPEVTIVPAASGLPTETVTLTLTASATPFDPIFPFTIAGLRARDYPGGEVRILELLESNADYTRYLIAYPSDGLSITGIMQIPGGEGPFPVLILNHGYYTRSRYYSGRGTEEAAVFFNRAGYLTLAPDYRSWGGSDVGYSLFHTGLVIDVLNLLGSISSIPAADPDRIGMWGHSMGGGITTRVLMIDSRLRAAFLHAPNSADDADLIARWGTGCVGDAAFADCPHADLLPSSLASDLVQAYLQAAADPVLLRQIAPCYHLAYISVPVQIHIGSADGQAISETPPEWSENLYQGMLAAGVDVDYFVYPGEGHFFQAAAWELMMTRAVEFFDRHVKGGASP
ncbi:MAG: alpha/beta fold hydrolase [Anaerolineales bacterium]|nr:alpha/beta fold hydrolase [Anaerolineales bacterium]